MIRQYRQEWMSRVGLSVMVTAVGCWSAASAGAAGYGNDPHGAAAPQGPIFKTLDALAGGIETVLQRTVLANRQPSSCAAIGCDDSCDQFTLRQFRQPAASGSVYQPVPLHHPGEPARRLQSEPSWAAEPHYPAESTVLATPDLPAAPNLPMVHDFPVAPSHPAAPALPAVPDFPAEPAVEFPTEPAVRAEPSFPAVSKVQPPPSIPAEPRVQAERSLPSESLVKRVPAALPELAIDPPSEPATLSTEDGWINSFSPSPPVAPRSQNQYDALSDPFLDDSPSGL